MEHHIDPPRIHHGWHNRLEPSLCMASGVVVHYDLLMAGHGQVEERDVWKVGFMLPLSIFPVR